MNQELNKGFIPPEEEVINFKPEIKSKTNIPDKNKEVAYSLSKMIEEVLKTPNLDAKVKQAILKEQEEKDLATKGVYLMEDENDDEDKRYVSEAMKNKEQQLKTEKIAESLSSANKEARKKVHEKKAMQLTDAKLKELHEEKAKIRIEQTKSDVAKFL